MLHCAVLQSILRDKLSIFELQLVELVSRTTGSVICNYTASVLGKDLITCIQEPDLGCTDVNVQYMYLVNSFS